VADLGIDIGPYRLLCLVDKGEFAAVYRARHRFLGTICAVKMLHPDQDTPIEDALAKEARIQARIVHRHVARVIDAGSWRGRLYLVMDWVEGPLLASVVDEGLVKGPAHAIDLFRGLARGVHAMHRRHVVHRDLKPSNVMVRILNRREEAVVIDFGLAKVLRPGVAPKAEGLSVEFHTLGTPEYMAPEQVANAGEVDQRADLFSLGVVLYELMTGDVPFHQQNEGGLDTYMAAKKGDYVRLRDKVTGLPEEIYRLSEGLLLPDPDQRRGTAREVLLELDRLRSRGVI